MNISDVECNYLTVGNYVQKIDILAEVANSHPRFKKVFEDKVLPKGMEADFASFLGGMLMRKFGEKFGFSSETQKHWPKIQAGTTFFQKVELLVPGSFQTINSEGQVEKRATHEKFFKRLENLRGDQAKALAKGM